MTRITVHVTQKEIDAARPGEPPCPIERALVDRFPRVMVGTARWFPDSKGLENYEVSRAASRFVRRFDAGLPVAPATFRLEAP